MDKTHKIKQSTLIAGLLLLAGCGKPNFPDIADMQLTSPHWQPNQNIPAQFTCDGDDISPTLEWSDIPSTTQSFVLIVRDPDAPRQEFIHWIVKDIPANVTNVADNTVPTGGIEVRNDFGQTNWGGPCPPNGSHRYHFEIYALDVPTISGNTLLEIDTAMFGHIVGKAELVGVFSR